MDSWQPIETAPKDGTEILAWRDDCGVLLVRYGAPQDWMTEFAIEIEAEEVGMECLEQPDWFSAGFFEGGYRLEGSEVPTYWMPLPEGPTP